MATCLGFEDFKGLADAVEKQLTFPVSPSINNPRSILLESRIKPRSRSLDLKP